MNRNHDGPIRLTPIGCESRSPSSRSGGGGRRRPRLVSFSPELAKGRSADEVGLEIEDVVVT